ncbi:hypothetical protein M413DRAFT_33173 [Hebeloma cylindrosporum]|uniref:Uncharacterized protein n=1 Tax=Hebeloma cylindrosporum TaxID=76867 RepID=A0A0C3BTC8_HEBCY|nr:hypothetical protein M413DRAFT_33173 [Hebeloma cylindrosporum h7]
MAQQPLKGLHEQGQYLSNAFSDGGEQNKDTNARTTNTAFTKNTLAPKSVKLSSLPLVTPPAHVFFHPPSDRNGNSKIPSIE